MSVMTEITVFQPNSRKSQAVIQSLVPRKAVDTLEERLGKEAADKANAALELMKSSDADLVQFRIGDRRIRVKQH